MTHGGPLLSWERLGVRRAVPWASTSPVLTGARVSGHGPSAALALATVAVLLACCSGLRRVRDERRPGCLADPSDHERAGSGPGADDRPVSPSVEDDPLVVVAHATRPQLRLTAEQAADLVARRGTPVSPAACGRSSATPRRWASCR